MPNTDWMATLSDDLYLPQLSIPGTHDTGCYQAQPQYWLTKYVRTQRLTIPQQLAAGTRAFDLRCGLAPDNTYHVYHGDYDQEILIQDAVDDIANFVTAHAGEVVLLLLKGEYGNINSINLNTLINNRLGGTLFPRPGGAQRWPRLSECRGRVLVLSRLPAPHASHYSTVGWPNNGFDDTVNVTAHYNVRIQDRWNNPFQGTKEQAIGDHLRRANTEAIQGNRTQLFLNFCSAFWANWTTLDVAPIFNQYLRRQFDSAGVIFVDDVSEDLASHIIGWNPRVNRARPPALDDNPPPRPPRRARRGSA